MKTIVCNPRIKIPIPNYTLEPNYIQEAEYVLPSYELALTRKHLINALSKMKPRHALVIIKRWGLDGDKPKTYAEIGQELHIGVGRVGQLLTIAHHKLLRHMNRVMP